MRDFGALSSRVNKNVESIPNLLEHSLIEIEQLLPKCGSLCFWNLDDQICANPFADSIRINCESPGHPQVLQPEVKNHRPLNDPFRGAVFHGWEGFCIVYGGRMITIGLTILFKIIARMQLLFSNYLGDYSYSFQGSSELISVTVTVSLLF